MSMTNCPECGVIFDTDFELECNEDGECICDDCSFEREER